MPCAYMKTWGLLSLQMGLSALGPFRLRVVQKLLKPEQIAKEIFDDVLQIPKGH